MTRRVTKTAVAQCPRDRFRSEQLRDVVTAAGFIVDALEEVEVAAEGGWAETQQFVFATCACS